MAEDDVFDSRQGFKSQLLGIIIGVVATLIVVLACLLVGSALSQGNYAADNAFASSALLAKYTNTEQSEQASDSSSADSDFASSATSSTSSTADTSTSAANTTSTSATSASVSSNSTDVDTTSLATSGESALSQANATISEQKTVRVAYNISESFQEGWEGEYKSGYGYEYLQKLSYYTGWKYEYVYGSFRELLDMLAAGEIDLMGNLSYTDERAQSIDFSTEEEGEEQFYLYVRSGQTQFSAVNPQSFNGARIAINEGVYQNELLEAWCKEQGVNCEFVSYSDNDARVAGMENGEVDAMLETERYMGYDWEPLVRIGSAPYYFGVSKTRPDLLQELNVALKTIQAENPFYNNEMSTKYTSETSVLMRTLTSDEQQWLKDNRSLKFGYMSDFAPYSYIDSQTGLASGVFIDVLENLAETYDFSYQLVPYSSGDELIAALANGQLDAAFPLYGDYGVGEMSGYAVSDAVMSSSMTVFYKNSSFVPNDSMVVAVSSESPLQAGYVASHYPGASVLVCQDTSQCVSSVMAGQADCFFLERSKAAELTESGDSHNLYNARLEESLNLSYAINRAEIPLLSILGKAVLAAGDTFISDSLVANSRAEINYSFVAFLRDNIIAVLLVLIVVFAFILIAVIAYARGRINNQRSLNEANRRTEMARWDAEHDVLTGLPNRAAFRKAKEELTGASEPLALAILDVDDFKRLNDNYGHEIGDAALTCIAQLLREEFSQPHLVFRLGGDEFIVLLQNTSKANSVAVAEQIERVNNALKASAHNVPVLSLSAGVAFSAQGYENDLYRLADQALYQAKAEGGSVCFTL